VGSRGRPAAKPIRDDRLDKAEKVCNDVAGCYSGRIDAIERLAAVEDARGHSTLAAALWRKAARWALAFPDFDAAADDNFDQASAFDDAAAARPPSS
jgi:hypothetical protein